MGLSSEQNVPSASIAVVDVGGRPQNNNNNKNSTMSVFAWAGAILINASFVALITWGSVSNWIVGFVFSVLYTVCLLVFGFWLRRRHRNITDQQTEEEIHPNESQTHGGNTLLTSLLLLLAVIALGVSGSYLPINLSECAPNKEYNGPDDCVLQENSNVPKSVESWWENKYWDHIWDKPSFAYLPGSETTIFQGSQRNENGLWKISAGSGAPEPFPNVSYVRSFVVIGNKSAVCFLADIATAPGIDTFKETLACTDGETIDTIENKELDYVNDLIYSDELIWVKGGNNDCYNDLYSIDPANLTDLTHHTQPLDNESSEESVYKCSETNLRLMFVGLLFLSALPAVVTSFLLGFLVKVPSMALSGYASLTWMVFCLVFTIQPTFEDIYDFFRWWLPFTSGPWLILLTLGSMTKRLSKNVLVWGINFSALVYIVSMFMLLQVFSEGDFWRWAVLTVLAIIPLIVISLATNKPFLMVLAALGLMVEAGRLAFYIADVADIAAGLIVSVVLALSGIALGFLGFLLSKQYSKIQTKVDVWTDKYLGRWKLLPHNEQGSDGNEASDEGSATSVDDAKNSKHSDVSEQNV